MSKIDAIVGLEAFSHVIELLQRIRSRFTAVKRLSLNERDLRSISYMILNNTLDHSYLLKLLTLSLYSHKRDFILIKDINVSLLRH